MLDVVRGDPNGRRPRAGVPAGVGHAVEIAHVDARRVHGDHDRARVVARVDVGQLLRRGQNVPVGGHPGRLPVEGARRAGARGEPGDRLGADRHAACPPVGQHDVEARRDILAAHVLHRHHDGGRVALRHPGRRGDTGKGEIGRRRIHRDHDRARIVGGVVVGQALRRHEGVATQRSARGAPVERPRGCGAHREPGNRLGADRHAGRRVGQDDTEGSADVQPADVLDGDPDGSRAPIGVTVQNVGGLNVSTTFSVVLTDATAGVTIGTQTVTGLAVGATATRTFNWSTTGAALGGHTLVATQSLTDDNAANNTRSVVVTVNTAPADLALASTTAPSRVTQGDTAPVVVTVQNVGGRDVTTSFDVVLTDGGTGGVTVGTQMIPGLAAGASATRTFNWNTAGVATNGHILTATQKLADVNSSNNARAIVVTVDPPSVHVGNLDGVADTSGNTGTWSATVRITAHDVKHNLLNGVTVSGSWNGSSSDVGQCSTSDAGGTGTCSVVLSSIPNATRLVSFAVTAMTLSGYVYKSSANHDPDGSSNGFSVTVKRQ